MKKIVFLLSCLAIVASAFAQKDDSLFIKNLSDFILTKGQAYENLRHLTKQIGQRLSGSAGMYKAEAWGLKTMKEAGADNAYLQACMVPHWVRGGKDEATTQSGNGNKKSLDVLALGNSLGSSKPVTAKVIEVKNFDELETRRNDVKDKIVFYNYPFNQTFIKTFEAYGDAVQYRGAGASRAAKYGAQAVIVRSMSESTDNIPHTGSLRYDTAYAKIPAVAVGLQDANWLSDALKKGSISVTLSTHGKFFPDTVGHNVIGELKGSEFPAEYITVGGHLDSWDPAEGAHDDGAGVVQTIEVLRAFKALGYKPKRTLRFVLFANEENGLRGGTKYAEEAQAKGEKHIFSLESDEGGFTPRGFGLTGSDAQFQKLLSWQPLLTRYGASEMSRGGGGSDIGPLNRTQGTPTAGLSPDSQRYFDYHHARNDVFEAVNKRELELSVVNMAALIYLVDKYGF
ncbi:M20/M25/M40 family metallo-hydrolase [Flavisolibacter ginsenosidimutans]|uniref:Carboxypeptidase Q n=1 Tax=Flavisolibacter ginsenosidimutans TaxID=661481 RepID=A0A5B8UGW2_9BACT|nr:M20/M25/M40 family metallo-hydrolase [Flavisolibacter ginsenosidimutans]QEC55864.1 M20/M25/M40 family metallo-hydrolase [Flavisolibacter ginsenosidimutans]